MARKETESASNKDWKDRAKQSHEAVKRFTEDVKRFYNPRYIAEQFNLPIPWEQVVKIMRAEREQWGPGRKPRVKRTSCSQVQLVFLLPTE